MSNQRSGNFDHGKNKEWDLVIQPHSSWYNLNLKDIYRYRDLLGLLVRRDIITVYKQTVLGPLWFIIQPILTTLVFTVIFGNVAKISTDGLPGILFYLCGITLWNYFAESLKLTSDVFTKNQNVFGKVYFPRAVVPLSIIVSNLAKLFIQMTLFGVVWVVFYFRGADISIQTEVIIFPMLIIIIAMIGLGLGMTISALTSKYRDLTFLVSFGVTLFMYATPVVYPASLVTGRFELFLWFNPLTSILEAFKYMFLGAGDFDWLWLGYSSLFAVIIFLLGLAIFNRTEKNFMDTV